jgi:hypothetical protein
MNTISIQQLKKKKKQVVVEYDADNEEEFLQSIQKLSMDDKKTVEEFSPYTEEYQDILRTAMKIIQKLEIENRLHDLTGCERQLLAFDAEHPRVIMFRKWIAEMKTRVSNGYPMSHDEVRIKIAITYDCKQLIHIT